ncbi:kynureninase [Delitschia confertaspora ATCC 74209]|uniref:Kynureninase n=1 Tax=Delitschia confertaspora ATCC 74209 TaxID=1513339 RepID=A0A9P4JMW8_9PLEO|nr:kynureninase [Delitschia confertaspora ATCC 74209]
MPKSQNPFAALDDSELLSEQFALQQDEKDELSHIRDEFIIPTKGDLKNKKQGPCTESDALQGGVEASKDSEPSVYLCGNSLGLQPRRTRDYLNKYLDTWATKGVYGHHKALEGGLPPWLHLDDAVKEQTAKIVGALPSEVVVMETLTANLHLLMSSFYRPTKERYKIIIEGKAFPSDHFAALSQLAHHGYPASSLILLVPQSDSSPYLSTEYILSTISQHAASTALVLLPGIQFYSGQYFDIKLITHHCHSLGITVGWDLAHAVGNVPVQLHDWNVDFAAWCNYKYMNGGPGVIGGLFVHERHGTVSVASPDDGPDGLADGEASSKAEEQLLFKPRLSGWWGSDKKSRFQMENKFVPIPGASGWQLSNPSALDMTSVMASLDIFSLTTMEKLREKSQRLTAYLEERLLRYDGGERPYTLITPSNPSERGAQISALLHPGLLDPVMEILEEEGVVVDERRPDVIRMAPAPLYNSYMDVHRFILIFQEACKKAQEGSKKKDREEVVMSNGTNA